MIATHTVIVMDSARADVRKSYRWLQVRRRVPTTALDRWIRRMEETVESLSVRPEIWPPARENKRSRRPLREKLFGRKPHVFRIIFTVENDKVYVLRIRRAGRRGLSQREIDEIQ